MGQQLNVFVLDRDGKPVKATGVTIDIEGIFWKGGTLDERTDNSGHARFQTAEDYEDYRKLKIRVRGQSFGPYRIGDGAYTVQLD